MISLNEKSLKLLAINDYKVSESGTVTHDFELTFVSICKDSNLKETKSTFTLDIAEKTIEVVVHIEDGNDSEIKTEISIKDLPLEEDIAKWYINVNYHYNKDKDPVKTKSKTVQVPGTSEPKPVNFGKGIGKGFKKK